ncbi:alpha/beta fold hydrolase [Pseudonocardia sp. CA-107938]|uniref:alpha/beta fold hydrolase n=1 Tax=Pseudonocardia sp. CA-107938 TaxID=3240021 RepID=UPI003D9147F7
MTSFVLVPGAGGQAWYWHRVVPLLQRHGHTAVAVELPATDETAGLAEYADAIVEASPEGEVVVVAQSMAGFSAPLVADRLPVTQFVLVNAMVPVPGETLGQWWESVDQSGAARAFALAEGRDPDAPFDPWETFFHDVPADVTAAAQAGPPPEQADRPFGDPWPLPAWPNVRTRFLAGQLDRLFPLALQQRVVPERLGIAVEELPGGHLVALSEPDALVDRLLLSRG